MFLRGTRDAAEHPAFNPTSTLICVSSPTMTTTALEVRGLTRKYGARYAVRNLDLDVLEGDVYGFLGPNGAGKTTAMRCIVSLIRRDAGDIKIFDETDLVRARRHLGAIIETPCFHDWMTGRENLQRSAELAGLTGKDVTSEVDRVLERVGLSERSKESPQNYSLGMRQRLGIARALLGKPRLLMLDEPTNGLDPAGMREIRELVRSLALHDQITIFISSHLLAEVQAVCNRVGIIQAGELRAEGRVDELIADQVEGRVVEISAADMTALQTALEAVEGVKVLGAARAGRLQVHHGELELPELNRRLFDQGVSVGALIPVERSLEDVFMEVTA